MGSSLLFQCCDLPLYAASASPKKIFEGCLNGIGLLLFAATIQIDKALVGRQMKRPLPIGAARAVRLNLQHSLVQRAEPKE